MLLISLSCYLLENYSWSFTHLWTKPHGEAQHYGIDAGHPAMPWEAPRPSEALELPTRSLVPLAKRGDRRAASRGGPGAPGRLLLPGTQWPNCVTPLSRKRSTEQGGFVCWTPGESPDWGAGGCCSSPALPPPGILAWLSSAQLRPNHS